MSAAPITTRFASMAIQSTKGFAAIIPPISILRETGSVHHDRHGDRVRPQLLVRVLALGSLWHQGDTIPSPTNEDTLNHDDQLNVV
jgi:hypothetical protein